MRNILLLAVGLFVTSAGSVSASCRTIPGASDLWARPSLRYLWIGETHGTAEIPAIFADIACGALAHGRRVTVALERPNTEQAAIDAVVGSKRLDAAETALLNQPDWREIYDGRTSQAMLEMLLELRSLKAHYPVLRVVAIVDPDAILSSPAAHDEAMGQAILALGRKQPDDLVLVLTGNVHGLKKTELDLKTAAMYLPADQLFSLQVTSAGGQAWMMIDKGCGAFSGGVPDKEKNRPLGIYADPSLARFGVVDGILALGRPTLASPPANPAGLATAPCRKTFLSQAGHEKPS